MGSAPRVFDDHRRAAVDTRRATEDEVPVGLVVGQEKRERLRRNRRRIRAFFFTGIEQLRS
jgi:hypothetical protein